jgi:hypothetical protein
MKHEGVEYYSLVTMCWHAPPSFNIFGQHPDINIDGPIIIRWKTSLLVYTNYSFSHQ